MLVQYPYFFCFSFCQMYLFTIICQRSNKLSIFFSIKPAGFPWCTEQTLRSYRCPLSTRLTPEIEGTTAFFSTYAFLNPFDPLLSVLFFVFLYITFSHSLQDSVALAHKWLAGFHVWNSGSFRAFFFQEMCF